MAGRGKTRISPEVAHFLHEFWVLAAFLLFLVLISNSMISMPSNSSESTIIDEAAIEQSIQEVIPEELPELPQTDGEE